MLAYINLLISCIVPLIYTPIMMRMLGQAEYGLYALSNSVVSYLSLLNFGIGSAIVRYISRCRALGNTEDVRRMLGLFLVIYSCLGCLVLVGGLTLIQFSGSLFGKGLMPEEISRLKPLILILSISTAISFPLSIYSSVVVTYERYLYNKLICLAETVAAPAMNLVVLFFGGGTVGMAMVALSLQVVNGLLYGGYCAKRLHLYPVFKKMPINLLKELMTFAAFVFMSSIVDMLYWATDKVLIGAMISSVAVAIYNVGGTFTAMLQNMSYAIGSVFSPRVNMMVAKEKPKKEISDLLIRVGRLQFLVVSLILSGYIVFGQAFLKFWAGDEYADAYYVALLTMVPLSIPLIQSLAFATVLAENKHRFRSIVYACIAVVNVISTWLILPYYGIIGAAACTALSFVLGQGIIMNIYYHRVTGLDIPRFWNNILSISIVPAVMVVAGLLITRLVVPIDSLMMLLIGAMCFTAVFAVATWFISMNRYEKDLVWGMVRKVLPKR